MCIVKQKLSTVKRNKPASYEERFSHTRIASIDVCEMGNRKHHVAALIELDVTGVRHKIHQLNRQNASCISFNAWLLHTIARSLKKYPYASAYLKGKKKRILFEDINISMLVEKEQKGERIPVPLLIEQADKIGMEAIGEQIRTAREQKFGDKDVVLQRSSGRLEQFYYNLPGFMRRWVWWYILRHPKLAFRKMGNVAITSIGMMGQVKGWFIPLAVHPVCFGISSITKKPLVVDGEVAIREVLNMTVLLDHDVIDGANMARFISSLSKDLEKGDFFLA